jgi:hypothetical protein
MATLSYLRCPECDSSTVTSIAEVDINDDFKCDMCGCSVDARELKTPTGERLIDHLMRLAADKFHGDEKYRVAR